MIKTAKSCGCAHRVFLQENTNSQIVNITNISNVICGIKNNKERGKL